MVWQQLRIMLSLATASKKWHPRDIRDSRGDGWNDRTPLSRDFTQRLLRPAAGDRPTAAKALHHPWLKGLTPLCGVNFRADNEAPQGGRGGEDAVAGRAPEQLGPVTSYVR
ncbi:unnamed protein product [Prorocentrum cordatum]|uniref:Non-specific serine/threonine protein kinase n=1 Tax=Prorocentrum cordatum TaxID=2364126 RepID=A0ABN9PBM5_9DINO|nr:unnamed protein product [Polarella glacialis]